MNMLLFLHILINPIINHSVLQKHGKWICKKNVRGVHMEFPNYYKKPHHIYHTFFRKFWSWCI